MSDSENLVPYRGDASILANCLRSALQTDLAQKAAEERAFKVATCRPINRQDPTDVRHLSDAYALLGMNPNG